jgi:hypothetical protein
MRKERVCKNCGSRIGDWSATKRCLNCHPDPYGANIAEELWRFAKDIIAVGVIMLAGMYFIVGPCIKLLAKFFGL